MSAIVHNGLLVDANKGLRWQIPRLLQDPDFRAAARAFLVGAPPFQFVRLRMPAIRERGRQNEWLEIMVHFFSCELNQVQGKERMHNHSRPFAASTLSENGDLDGVAYHMFWERRNEGCVVDSGEMDVRFLEPYGIGDHINVYHSVVTVQPHISVVVFPVTEETQPSNRKRASEVALSQEETEQYIVRAVNAINLSHKRLVERMGAKLRTRR